MKYLTRMMEALGYDIVQRIRAESESLLKIQELHEVERSANDIVSL